MFATSPFVVTIKLCENALVTYTTTSFVHICGALVSKIAKIDFPLHLCTKLNCCPSAFPLDKCPSSRIYIYIYKY
jgi:hypothetical protein